MLNLSDKDIDRLSREAADSFEPDHSSLSWSRLEHMLTKQMPERPPDGFRFGRINPYVWGPALVFIAGISFYLIKNNFYSQNSTRIVSPAKQLSSPSSIYDSSVKANTNTEKGRANRAETNPDIDSRSASSVTQTPDKGTGAGLGSDPGAATNSGTSNQLSASNAQYSDGVHKKTDRKIPVKDSQIPAILLAGGTGASVGNGLNSFGSALENASTDKLYTPGPRVPYSLPPLASTNAHAGNVKGNDSLLIRSGSAKSPVVQNTVHINRSLNFGFAFGPDYTNAGGISNNQFGNNVGLTVGYYLTSKLSINSGVLYSNKFYWSPGYGPGRPSQTAGNPASITAYGAAAPTYEYVNGSANLYEIPLTLRYDFGNSGKSKFFANAGLSSYFIMSQSSIYFFHSAGRPSAWKKTDNSQVNYWFGIADISLGVETDMGKGFSFQAEPFLKIPLKRMGMENVKLSTYGFLLSFRYTPVLSRSKK